MADHRRQSLSAASDEDEAASPTVLWMTALVAAVLLSGLFWETLWSGGGLIGGDIYSYYLPQKQFYAEHLSRGEIPLWHNLTGHGYPLLAESQTGVFYPFHLLFYRLFSVTVAYNTVQLLHYILAFVFCWLYARRLGLTPSGAGLAALIFTYGWFPARICLEWAIVTGAWLPAALWAAESYVQTRRRGALVGLSLVLAVQLLAGHFALAFITQLTVAAYLPLRLWLGSAPAAQDEAVSDPLPSEKRGFWRPLAWGVAAIACGFGLAGFQVLPTWELKQQSQRAVVTQDHDPAIGFLPAWYLPQVVAPWVYYTPDQPLSPPGGPRTNKTEAHLYFGLLPLALLVLGLLRRRVRSAMLSDRRLWIWAVLGGLALIYATGVLVPFTRILPGFSFFEGPGRFGIVTTLGVALAAGLVLSRLMEPWSGLARAAGMLIVFGVTIGDLWIVGQWAQDGVVYFQSQPTLTLLPHSPVREILAEHRGPVRLLAPGRNLPTLLGVASTDPELIYLGLGPAEYFDPDRTLPGPFAFDQPPTPEQLSWLRRAGVTHLLSMETPVLSAWPVAKIWMPVDPFLNSAWGRATHEPLVLLELSTGRGRIAWDFAGRGRTAKITEYSANRVTARVTAKTGGNVILTDLAYPGWEVFVDGKPGKSSVADEMYRQVAVPSGDHLVEWRFRPASLRWGIVVSSVTLLLLCGGLVAGGRSNALASPSAAS